MLTASAQTDNTGNEALLTTGRLMATQGNYTGALDRLRLVDRNALSADRRMEVALDEARWLYGAGLYNRAYDAFSAFVNQYPFSTYRTTARKGAADCLFAAGDYTGAYDIYSGIDTKGLNKAEAAECAYRSGISALETGKNGAATHFMQSVGYGPLRSASYFYLGKIAYDKGDYTAALRNFKNVNTYEAPGNRAGLYLAAIDFVQGNYAQALATARRELRTPGLDNETVGELNRIAGESLYRQDDNNEACEYLRKYVKLVAEPLPSALYILGIDAFNNGEYTKALEYMRPVTERGEGALRQSAYLYAGQCLLEEGDTDAALLAFDKATQDDFDPEVREAAYYNYAAARLAGATLPFSSSAETFEKFLRLYPTGPYSDRVAAYLASGYMADNDYERALERINSISSPSQGILGAKQRILYTLGLKSLREGDAAQARTYLDEAAALAKSGPELANEVTLAQGQTLYALGDVRQAAGKYRSYLRSAGKNDINRPVALYGLAYSLYKGGDASGAATYFAQAAETLGEASARADALNRLGDIAGAKADFAGAAQFFAKAFSANPSAGDYAALNEARMKGYMRDYQGKLDALRTFERDFSSSVLMPDALLEITEAQISLGRNADAVETYRTLISRYPKTAQGRRGYLQMAMTLLDMGRNSDAEDAYRAVIQQYPTSEEAAQASSLLKTLCADAGRGDEYLKFIKSVDNAPQVSADDEEELTYSSAMAALRQNGNTIRLEEFVERYPNSPRAAEALGTMLAKAREKDDKSAAADYAARIIERYPDSKAAEQAYITQAQASYSAGDLPGALQLYQALAQKASDASTATAARMGVMRTARDMGNYDLAGMTADAIIASSAEPAEMSEAKFTKAKALDAAGNTKAAISLWQEMADNTADLFGAKSAFEAADALHRSNEDAKALKAAKKFVQSGSPHRYWVARGFILLSDIYSATGKDLEAREYLEALRDNYPGNEPDIFMMIEQRLADKKN